MVLFDNDLLDKYLTNAIDNSLLDNYLNNHQFIGVYIRCSGFNAEQFYGKGVSEDLWKMLYTYFWELWIGERLTSLLIDLQHDCMLKDFNESHIVKLILDLFLKPVECNYTLDALRTLLLKLQKDIIYEIQNFIFSVKKNPEVPILLAANSLTYGIPNVLSQQVPFFNNKRIIYLGNYIGVSTEKCVNSLFFILF